MATPELSQQGPGASWAAVRTQLRRLRAVLGSRWFRLALWPAGVVAGIAALYPTLSDEGIDGLDVSAYLYLFVGWAFIFSGLAGWMRRPENLIGALMTTVGFTWFLGAILTQSSTSLVFTIGVVFSDFWNVLLVYLLLAFPAGRITSRLDWSVVGLFLVPLLPMELVWLLFLDPEEGDEPANAFLVWPNAQVADAIDIAQRAILIAAIGILVVVVARRWLHASAPLRRFLVPVIVGTAATVLFVPILLLDLINGERIEVFERLALIAFTSTPIVFLVGLLRGRLARAQVGRLLIETPETPTLEEAEEGLRRALGDRTLELAYWIPESEGYVHPDGSPFELPPDGEGRTTTKVAYEGQPVAALVHDASLLDERELLDAVVAAARIALVKDRLQAELRARLDELERERDFIRDVVDNSPSFFCVLDPEGRILRFNKTLEQASGCVDDVSCRGRSFWDVFIAPESAAETKRVFEGALRGLPASDREDNWVAKDGPRMDVIWSITPIQDELGRQLYLVTGLDVTWRKRQEDQLRESEARFRDLANNAPVMIWLADPEGRLTFFNERWLEFVGRSLEQELGDGWQANIHPEDAEVGIDSFVAAVRARDVYEREYRLRRADGEYCWVLDRGLPRIRPDGTLAGYTGITVEITERKLAEEAVRASRARIVQAADAERKRLERNLHDGAQQRLVSISLALQVARARLDADPDGARAMLASATEELGHATEELRELARGLHPAILSDRGLAPALRLLAGRAPVPVELIGVPEERLPESVEAAAYYVVAEALTNVAKYAHASTASVGVTLQNGCAIVEVSDDGIGGADPGDGSGLRGLADRVEALAGRLQVESPPGVGTRLRAEIPCER